MRLRAKYFDNILNGTKRIEIRLNDEKRRLIKIGDTITFYKMPEEKESITVKVVDLLHYKSFKDLLNDYDISIVADENDTKDNLLKILGEFYSKEEENKYGVLGIKIKKD
jgi:ASC-1-like (ASCH) protein